MLDPLLALETPYQRGPTPTGRRPYRTCRNSTPAAQPRIARRWVRHSVAITLDWNLSASEARCLSWVLSLPREGVLTGGLSAGLIASQLHRDPSTARRWLRSIEAQGYWHILPGKRRGQLKLLLHPKATQWRRLGAGDLQTGLSEKQEKPANPPLSGLSRALIPPSKVIREERKKEAREEGPGDKLVALREQIATLTRAARAARSLSEKRRYWDLVEQATARERAMTWRPAGQGCAP